MKKLIFTIEASKDGRIYHHQTSFKEGEISRWNTPFTSELAIKETQDFAEVRKKHWPYVRLVIDITPFR